MNILKLRPSLLASVAGRPIVRKYNKVALGLTEYEMILYRAWAEHVTNTNTTIQVEATS